MKKLQTNKLGLALLMVCAMMMTIASALVFAACGTSYRSKPGTMDEIVGTYQLTTYTQKDDDDNDVDRLTQWNVKAYLVVGADGHGYYAYQDDNTEFWYDTVLIRYGKDEDNQDLYKSIQFTTGVTDTRISYQKPGYGYEPTMGFNADDKTFNYTISNDPNPRKGVYPSYYTDVVYTKISEQTDLTTIVSETNRTLAPLAQYELKNLNGLSVLHAGAPDDNSVVNPLYNKYKYFIMDFNALNQTADFYYELVAGDDGAQVEKNVKIDVALTTTTQNDYDYTYLSLKILDEEFTNSIGFGAAPRYINYEVTAPTEYGYTHVYSNWFDSFYDDSTVDELIAMCLENYNNGNLY